MLTDTKVRIFTNSQPGAPAANLASLGGMIALLDACLVAGYGTATLGAGAMTRTGAIVTVAMTGHNHMDHSVLLIAGAAQAEYNGMRRIQVDDNNSFSFELPAGVTPATPATGTITIKVAPAGWSKVFTATNKAVYRPADGPRHYLRVDDTYAAIKCKVRAYRAMSTIDVGTGAYPAVANAADTMCCWMKNNTGEWWVVADDKGMHLIVTPGDGSYQASYYFGWFRDLYVADADACSVLTVGQLNTGYATANSGVANYEQTGLLWNCAYVLNNDPIARVDGCSGYLAKSFDSVQDCVAFGFVGYAMPDPQTYNIPYATMNNQTPHAYAALKNLGNFSGNAAAASLRGYTLAVPFLYEPSYFAGTSQLRGMLPFIQCIGMYPATARHRKVARNDVRFKAFLSLLRIESWATADTRMATLIPLGNWEEVL